MKTNSCYSLFIILLATFPLSGMKGPEKAIQKKSTKKNIKNTELTVTNLTALFGSLPIERFSLSNLNDLVKKCGNPLILLHQAITQNNIDLVEALLQYKLVEPNKELNGFTALHKASKDQSIELLTILLPHTQASLSQKDRDELLPIDYAIKTMNLDMVKIFINYNSPISKSLIADAVFEADDDSQDHVEIINLLCQKYSSSIDLILDKEDYLQETALEAALHENKIKIIELLLKNGAQSNGPKNADTAPLFFAVRDSAESILLLRKYDADVSKKAGLKRKDFVENIILKEDMTPADFARQMYNEGLRDATWLTTVLQYLQCNSLELLLATIKGNQPTALKKLLDHNLVNPHQKLVDGQTILHMATQISDLPIELLEILLKHTQQSISLLDGNNALPIDYTIENMNLALTKILIEHNSPIGKHSIIGAVVYANENNKDHLEIITLLCEKHPSFIDEITQLFNDMNTPLIAAIVLNKIKIVELLLNKGANPNFKDTSLMTPLLNAVYYNIHSIPLLIQYGADIRTTAGKDEHGLFLKEGMTPADYAQELFNKGVNDKEWFDSVLKYLNPLHTLITHIENLHIEEKHINEEKNEDKMETD